MLPRAPVLADLLVRSDIRRATDLARVARPSVPTGFPALDAQLPGGGWPSGALTEILPAHQGIGELRLLGPALAGLSRKGRRLAWIAPPHLPYAPALDAADIDLSTLLIVRTTSLTDTLWAAEQCLRSAACGAVLLWPQQLKYAELRRLQLAADGTDAMAVLFRPPSAADQASPAALRLGLATADGGLAVRILKRRGAALQSPVRVEIGPPTARTPFSAPLPDTTTPA